MTSAAPKDHDCDVYSLRNERGQWVCQICKQASPATMDIAAELRALRNHAAMTRGEQAYRELPRYVIRKCGEILKALDGDSG